MTPPAARIWWCTATPRKPLPAAAAAAAGAEAPAKQLPVSQSHPLVPLRWTDPDPDHRSDPPSRLGTPSGEAAAGRERSPPNFVPTPLLSLSPPMKFDHSRVRSLYGRSFSAGLCLPLVYYHFYIDLLPHLHSVHYPLQLQTGQKILL